ncbi:MAG: response regulator [Bacteroidales bacterium]|nr:response regulator [Bacteroidales bacterium]
MIFFLNIFLYFYRPLSKDLMTLNNLQKITLETLHLSPEELEYSNADGTYWVRYIHLEQGIFKIESNGFVDQENMENQYAIGEKIRNALLKYAPGVKYSIIWDAKNLKSGSTYARNNQLKRFKTYKNLGCIATYNANVFVKTFARIIKILVPTLDISIHKSEQAAIDYVRSKTNLSHSDEVSKLFEVKFEEVWGKDKQYLETEKDKIRVVNNDDWSFSNSKFSVSYYLLENNTTYSKFFGKVDEEELKIILQVRKKILSDMNMLESPLFQIIDTSDVNYVSKKAKRYLDKYYQENPSEVPEITYIVNPPYFLRFFAKILSSLRPNDYKNLIFVKDLSEAIRKLKNFEISPKDIPINTKENFVDVHEENRYLWERIWEMEKLQEDRLDMLFNIISRITWDESYKPVDISHIKESDPFADVFGGIRILQEDVIQIINDIKQTTTELETHKNHLEKIVEERTVELVSAKEKAENADKLKSAFLANMSHEIRTPMNSILGFSEMLASESLTETKRLGYLKQIQDSGKNLLNIINDILDFAKIESGEISILTKPCDIKTLVFDVFEGFKQTEFCKFNNNNLNLEFSPQNFEIDRLIVETDGRRLRQVIINLLNNACKFTERGKVSLSLHKDENNFLITVKDTGIGIPEEKIESIFERFTQVHKNTYGGTGLGLAISKNIVELLGGKILLKSSVGHGSEFTLVMPLQQTINTATETKSSYLYPNFEKNTILIVEDEESNYFFISEVLSKTKANLVHAKNAEEAIDFFCNREFSLVIMDVRLPGKSGYEATKILKEINPTIPVIACTAYAMAGEDDRCREAGCDDYISKPVKPKQLVEVIKRNLINS